MNDSYSSSENLSTKENWVVVNSVEEAEEATSLNQNKKEESLEDKLDNDESDGISVISSISSNVEDENLDETPINKEYKPEKERVWTYVDNPVSNSEDEPSKNFYLNCMQEPVQELTEQELDSLHSDLESEVSGIYASECEFLDECGSFKIEPDKERTIIVQARDARAEAFRNNNIVVWITIFVALMSLFLSSYFIANDSSTEEIPSKPNLKSFKDSVTTDNFDDLNILDPKVYCKEKHKNDGIYTVQNIKKCLKKQKTTNKQKQKNESKKDKNIGNDTLNENMLKIKEEYLKQKEEFLIKKEYELKQAEIKLKKDKENISKCSGNTKKQNENIYKDENISKSNVIKNSKKQEETNNNSRKQKENIYKDEENIFKYNENKGENDDYRMKILKKHLKKIEEEIIKDRNLFKKHFKHDDGYRKKSFEDHLRNILNINNEDHEHNSEENKYQKMFKYNSTNDNKYNKEKFEKKEKKIPDKHRIYVFKRKFYKKQNEFDEEDTKYYWNWMKQIYRGRRQYRKSESHKKSY